MDWKDWEPLYREIVDELGIDPAADMESAMLLRHICGHLQDCTAELDQLIRGKPVAVFGPSTDPRGITDGSTVISAGSPARLLMGKGPLPDVMVTDLDGDFDSQLEASDIGAITAVHAHGDNIEAVRELAPRFRGPVLCTTQTRPFPGIHNFGGFTDGDRAVFMALHFGASSIALRGFDLDNPVPKPGSDMTRKAAKLRIARRLLDTARRIAHAGTSWDM
jgi:hypothetical protein